jgi:hypothetical protein
MAEMFPRFSSSLPFPNIPRLGFPFRSTNPGPCLDNSLFDKLRAGSADFSMAHVQPRTVSQSAHLFLDVFVALAQKRHPQSL